MDNKHESMNTKQSDFLKELGNIGTGNALTSLSKFTQSKLEMGLPRVSMVTKEEFIEQFGVGDTPYIGTRVEAECDLDLAVSVLMSQNSANEVLKLLGVAYITSAHEMSPDQKSCMEELGNILCNSYLNVFAAMFHLKLQTSKVELATGSCMRVLDLFFDKYITNETKIIMVENRITSEDWNDNIHILLQPRQDSIEKVFALVGE